MDYTTTQIPSQEAESLRVLREEVEDAVHCLKAGESPGVDNISSENGGAVTIIVLTAICKKIWETKEWTQSLVIPLPKKGNLKQCQNCRTTSLVSHPSKIMF